MTFQGWNLWAIAGVAVTVIWALYDILCKHHAEIDALNVGYILSGMLSLVLCYLLWGKFGRDIFVRERGVDINKLRYLEEIAPKVYLWSALCCSLVFTVFSYWVMTLNHGMRFLFFGLSQRCCLRLNRYMRDDSLPLWCNMAIDFIIVTLHKYSLG